MNFKKPLLQLAVFAALAGVFSPSPSHAYKMLHLNSSTTALNVPCEYTTGFAHWPSSQGPIYWFHNTSGAGAGADKKTAIQNALDTWTTATQSDHVLVYAGTTNAGQNANDLQNTIVWTSASGLCGTACHAITVVRFNSAQVVSDVDIVLNNQMDWRTDGSFDPTCADSVVNPDGTPRLNVAVDTQAVLTHELGHSLGLGHTTDPAATMGGASCKVAGRTLNSDDQAGLQCSTNRYPLDPFYEGSFNFVPNCTQIAGWAQNADRPNDPAYVNIVDGSTLKAVVPADRIGDSFTYTIPFAMKNGQWHTIHTRFSGGTEAELDGSPRDLICHVKLLLPNPPPSQYLPTDGLPYEVATQFSSSVAGKIEALGYFFAPNETGTHTIRLWSDTGTLLASKSITPSALNRDVYVSITPVAIQANVRYRVSITTYTEQSKTPCGLPLVNGPLTAIQGFWKQGDGVFPTTSSCSNFHVSVEFDM